MTPKDDREEFAFEQWEAFEDFRMALWALSIPGWPHMDHSWQWAGVRVGLA